MGAELRQLPSDRDRASRRPECASSAQLQRQSEACLSRGVELRGLRQVHARRQAVAGDHLAGTCPWQIAHRGCQCQHLFPAPGQRVPAHLSQDAMTAWCGAPIQKGPSATVSCSGCAGRLSCRLRLPHVGCVAECAKQVTRRRDLNRRIRSSPSRRPACVGGSGAVRDGRPSGRSSIVRSTSSEGFQVPVAMSAEQLAGVQAVRFHGRSLSSEPASEGPISRRCTSRN